MPYSRSIGQLLANMQRSAPNASIAREHARPEAVDGPRRVGARGDRRQLEHDVGCARGELASAADHAVEVVGVAFERLTGVTEHDRDVRPPLRRGPPASRSARSAASARPTPRGRRRRRTRAARRRDHGVVVIDRSRTPRNRGEAALAAITSRRRRARGAGTRRRSRREPCASASDRATRSPASGRRRHARTGRGRSCRAARPGLGEQLVGAVPRRVESLRALQPRMVEVGFEESPPHAGQRVVPEVDVGVGERFRQVAIRLDLRTDAARA